MLSESEIKKMYQQALERATEYALSANDDKHADELYQLHVYHAATLGAVLEIDSHDTMKKLKDMITMRYTKHPRP